MSSSFDLKECFPRLVVSMVYIMPANMFKSPVLDLCIYRLGKSVLLQHTLQLQLPREQHLELEFIHKFVIKEIPHIF